MHCFDVYVARQSKASLLRTNMPVRCLCNQQIVYVMRTPDLDMLLINW